MLIGDAYDFRVHPLLIYNRLRRPIYVHVVRVSDLHTVATDNESSSGGVIPAHVVQPRGTADVGLAEITIRIKHGDRRSPLRRGLTRLCGT